MNERPKPNWLRRAGITMAILGTIGTVGATTDGVIIDNAVEKKVDAAFPQTPSLEEFSQARATIIIFIEKINQLIQQGKSVDIPSITAQPKFQQSSTLVSEYNKRQQERSALRYKHNKRVRLDFMGAAGSLGLAFAGGLLWMQTLRPQENRRQPRSIPAERKI